MCIMLVILNNFDKYIKFLLISINLYTYLRGLCLPTYWRSAL